MDTSTVVWIIVAVIAVLILAAVVGAMLTKQKKERDRGHAGELREQASTQAAGVQQREAEARETDARARQAQAEADRKAAEAERLQADSVDRQSAAASNRDEHDATVRQADKLDPNVDHKHGETGGYGTESDPQSSDPATTPAGETYEQDRQADPAQQRYDAEGNPIDPAHTDRGDVDPGRGSHRA